MLDQAQQRDVVIHTCLMSRLWGETDVASNGLHSQRQKAHSNKL